MAFAFELAVPFVKFPIAFFALVVAALDVAPFRTVVALLPSLVSLLALTLRPVLVAGLEAGAFEAAGAARRALVGWAPAELALVLELVVTFLVPPARVDLAFSTKLDNMFVAAAVRDPPLRGDPGLAICDLAGETGRPLLRREFDEVGDRTWPGRTGPASPLAPRVFFFGFSMPSFSLSP